MESRNKDLHSLRIEKGKSEKGKFTPFQKYMKSLIRAHTFILLLLENHLLITSEHHHI